MSKKLISFLNKKNCITFLLICLPFVSQTPQKEFKNLLTRVLSGDTDSSQKTSKICEKTSSKFAQYYKLDDRSVFNMDEDNTEKYDSYYVKALINIVRHYYDKKREKQNDNTRILSSDEDSSDYKKNVLKYAYHILPLLIVLGIGILSFVVWIVWGICVCQKCKCCVCKGPKCKTPSIVLALIFYVIVSLISFYSLVERNKVFTGLADLECSILKFTDEVLEGENSPYPPYWAGIDNMRGILGQITGNISELKPNTENELLALKDDVNNKKAAFEDNFQNAGNIIKNDYIKTYGNQYQLDIANQFGVYNKINNEALPENSVSYFWLNEYNSLAIKSKTEMDNTLESFNIILNREEIIQSLSMADTRFEEIKLEFKKLKNLIEDKILEKADKIDNTGRIIYALFFSFLIIFSVAIIIFMLLLCCCSGEVCTNLTCFQCIFKYLLHIFWNIMALFMILLFLGGSMFTISGVLGDDLVNVISFLISEDNLGSDKDTIILGNVKQYLNKCFNDDGNILEELGFSTQMESFKKIKETQLLIEEIKNQFNDKLNKFVYSEYLEELKERVNFNSEEFKLVSVNSGITPSSYNFVSILEKINEYSTAHGKNEKWSITSTTNNECSSSNTDETGHTNEIIYHPKKCYPTVKSWINGGDTSLTDYKQKLNDMKTLIEDANDETNTNSIKSLLNGLNTDYTNFLNSEISSLEEFVDKMEKITDIVKDYTSEDDELFSFMNCKFVKSNVEVILFYLKNSFQNDVYEVGVYLLIAAFAMPFAISFTILLIVISNEEIEKNKENFIKKSKRISVNLDTNSDENKKLKYNEGKKELKNNEDLKNDNDITIVKNEGNITEQRRLKDDKKIRT